MTRTRKNLKIACLQFIGKIRRTLVTDLAYFILHQSLKTNCRAVVGFHAVLDFISFYIKCGLSNSIGVWVCKTISNCFKKWDGNQMDFWKQLFLLIFIRINPFQGATLSLSFPSIHEWGSILRTILIFSCLMLKNGRTYFKSLAVWKPQDFKSMFGHFSTLYLKMLK